MADLWQQSKGDFRDMLVSELERRVVRNPASGRKYDSKGRMLPFQNDEVKARSAAIFRKYWDRAESDPTYARLKREWILKFKGSSASRRKPKPAH